MEFNKSKRKMEVSARATRRVVMLLPAGVSCVVFAIIILNIDLIQIITNSMSQIKTGSNIFKILQRETPSLLVSAFLFNVTNAEAFLSGEDPRLKVQEVGPFTYREMRSNAELEVDEDLKVARYSPRTVPVFLPDHSIANPEDVNVTMPNLAVLSMSSMVGEQGYFAKLSFSALLSHLGSKPMVSTSALQYLWGYPEPLISLANTVLPGWINFDKIGLLDRMYDPKLNYRLEVSTAVHEKFKVKTMNGLGGLKVWDYEDPTKRTTCNTFTDTYEGIAYGNDMVPGAPLRLYRDVLCRQMPLQYNGRGDGPSRPLRYAISSTAYECNNDTACQCGRGMCRSGISDLSPCYYGLPLALSNAHFLGADPELYERIEGISPNEEEHGSEILIEPRAGIVEKTKFSVQVNLVINKIDFNTEAGRFSNMVIPVCLLKLIQPELSEENVYNIKLMYVIAPNLILALVIVFFLVGILLIAYSVHLLLPRIAYFKSKGIIFRPPKEGKPPGNVVPLLSVI